MRVTRLDRDALCARDHHGQGNICAARTAPAAHTIPAHHYRRSTIDDPQLTTIDALQVNAGLVKVKPPTFYAAEWEKLGAEGTDDSYAAVDPGGSAETMPGAKKQKK